MQKILVVYDPTRPEQPALERAAAIARQNGARLVVYACIHSDLARSADRAEETKWLIEAQREKLSSAVAPLCAEDIDVSTEVDWDKDWYRAVVHASARHCADLVLKSTYQHSPRERFLNRTSDWTLIRECQCPVLLVREGERPGLRRVVAAIDIKARGDGYERLNRQIIEFSRRVMSADSAEVHFINAFEDLSSIPDRNTLLRDTGAASDHVHIQMGVPEKVIVEHAHDLQAGLVVVGNSGRTGLSALFSGNTVEKVLDKLECDVLSMP